MKRWFSSLIAAVLALVSQSAAFADGPGIVTFTVDDLSRSFFEIATPIFQAGNINGTLFVNAGRLIEDDAEYYALRIMEMNAAGWEIGAHGFEHADFTTAGNILLERELGAAAALIYRATGIYPTTLSSPYGLYDDTVIGRAALYYDAHVRSWGARGFNEPDNVDHFEINRSRVAADRYASPDAVCQDIAKAGREGQWLVLMFHYFKSSRVRTETEEKYTVGTDWLEEIVECADDQRERGNIKVTTVADALVQLPSSLRR